MSVLLGVLQLFTLHSGLIHTYRIPDYFRVVKIT